MIWENGISHSCEFFSTFPTTAVENFSPANRLHPLSKAMLGLAAPLAGLISSLNHIDDFSVKLIRR